MLVYPVVQAQAHAKLDKIVGRACPPSFEDAPFSPLYQNNGKRDSALVTHRAPWRAARLDIG